MKDKILRFVSYALVAALSAFCAIAVTARAEYNSSKLLELESLIQQKFIGEADFTAMEDAAAEAMVSATGDRWSYYIPAAEYAAYEEQMQNAYVGVGITIQVEEGGFRIISVTPGGPAEEAGIQQMDLLIMVNGQDVRGMDTTEVRDLVRGEEGTKISMTVLRDESSVTMEVERRRVETVVADYEMLVGNIGLVTIYNFDLRCAQETIAAIEALLEEGAEKLIFDVRGNPGGYASELVEVLDYLLPEGEVFHTVSYNGKEDIDYSDANYLDVPMAVLVDGNSYSAAEFFAAALQEYEAALVVGTQTCGKGYFQMTYRLSDGSAVALSVGKYYTPKGENLANIGIAPDVVVEVDAETEVAIYYGTLPTQEDPQIQAAMDVLNNK